ncbi:Na+/H+ antiporter subunit E [Agaricicola taiwanensis]|uniref:Na+/H+ antiporter subunit E n=1 Tax=Agaricicola taiwanensis TaxID=591372 RepID=A0A8J2YMM8_9RHOB|nr:Na+/H+ antiporter subunit E [Agaricicola taiwanensis]GGE54241.1 Na+/H+ antiporter subunit E [Agaricicola taiwanensis]
MSRVLPYPLLTAGLILMWLLLNAFTPGHLILGTLLAVPASLAMAQLHPAKPRLHNWRAIARLAGVVIHDIAVSNISVARIMFSGARLPRTSGFVAVTLDLQDPTALALLAWIINNAPGTAWVEYRAATGRLLVHVLDLKDDQDWAEIIKNRYEPLLMEIFE